jgi:hypothetical protein
MVELEREVNEGEEPAEEGHGTVEVVIRDSVETARTLQEREIVSDEAEAEEDGSQAAGELIAGVEKSSVGAET